jgi:hypothetical protein
MLGRRSMCSAPWRRRATPSSYKQLQYYFMAAPCQSDQGNLRIKTNTCTARGSLNKEMLLKGTLARDFLLLIYFLLLIFSSIVLIWSSDSCPQLFFNVNSTLPGYSNLKVLPHIP